MKVGNPMWGWSTAFFTLALVTAIVGVLGFIDIFNGGWLIIVTNLLLGITCLFVYKPPY